MPCSDITETIKIILDPNDRLVDYTFLKRACGGNIGQKSMLLPQLKDKTVEEIIKLSQADLIDKIKPEDKSEEFLIMKHLSVIQFCFEMHYGKKELDPKNIINIYSINYDEDGTVLEADVKLVLDINKIELCGNYGCRV